MRRVQKMAGVILMLFFAEARTEAARSADQPSFQTIACLTAIFSLAAAPFLASVALAIWGA